MLRVIRNPAQRINFQRQKTIEPLRHKPTFRQVAKFTNNEQEESKINRTLIEKFQRELELKKRDLEKKEELLEEREHEIEKNAEFLSSLSNINLEDLNYDELKRLSENQKGAIKDLLENYIESSEKETRLKEEMQKLKERPWAGKSSKQIEREIQELKARNKELTEEIENVLVEIEKLQEE